MRRIFFSSSGLRSGWALALFLVVYSALTLAVQFSFATIPVLRGWAVRQPHGVLSPAAQIEFTGLELLILLLSVEVTNLAEKRSFGSRGLDGHGKGGRLFLQGTLFGCVMASALIGLLGVLGGYSIRGLALHGGAIAENAILYGIGFVLVGLFEELAFRGMLQSALQRGIGIWPAAILLSLGFGAVHLPQLQGVWVGALVAACFGMMAVFSVVRTRSLWFIIGTHAAFDWAIAFFFSAPIAGQPAQGHLLDAALSGPAWLTGGNAGPVGSAIASAVFVFAALAIHFVFPAKQRAS